MLLENKEEFELMRNTKSVFLICLQWFFSGVALLFIVIAIEIPSDPLTFKKFIDESNSIEIIPHLKILTTLSTFFKALLMFLAISISGVAFLVYKFRAKRKFVFAIEKTLKEVVGAI